jgi:hypothetical protein
VHCRSVAFPLVGTIRSAYHDGFLQKRALERVRGYSSAQQLDIERLHRAGKERWRGARDLADGGQYVAALLLYRQALALFLLATDRAKPDSEPRSVADASEAIALLDSLALTLPAGSERVIELLSDSRPLAFDDVPPKELPELYLAAERLLGWLGREVEPRTLRRVKIRRALHFVGVALAGLVVIALLVSWALRPPNLARGKTVTQSSNNADSTAAPGGLTDGSTRGAYGIHTNKEAKPWVAVDLGKSRSIGRVEIFNRGDGWLDDGLPMVLEISEDGESYTEVATRKARFTQSAPWVERLGGRSARWVRVRARPGSYVALSEIEVYEKP